MKQHKTAGLIIASQQKAHGIQPLMKVGSLSVIRRMVLTYQMAGIQMIVIVTGHEAKAVEKELAGDGTILLTDPNYQEDEMLDAVKIGVDFLKDKCQSVLISPSQMPSLMPETIVNMLESEGQIIVPSYQQRQGHPVLLSQNYFGELLDYRGESGLKSFLTERRHLTRWVNVSDTGILYATEEMLLRKVNAGQVQSIHPAVKIALEHDKPFFDSRAKLLLMLIVETHSVKAACSMIGMSYSKAWNILNALERELGYTVVQRRHGGSGGGKTFFTQNGLDFLNRYDQFESNIREFVRQEFKKQFQSDRTGE